MFKVVSKHCLLKLERFEDEKTIALWVPPNMLPVLLFLQ